MTEGFSIDVTIARTWCPLCKADRGEPCIGLARDAVHVERAVAEARSLLVQSFNGFLADLEVYVFTLARVTKDAG